MNPSKRPLLSKSRFLAGLQCQLRLWHQCYNRELASEISPAQQAIFDAGQQVGRQATSLYPGKVLIQEDHLQHPAAVQSTLAAMDNPEIPAIFEAAFFYDDVRIRVDILQRVGDGRWNLIEVKSATSIKEVYLPDVAVQYRVLSGSGLKLGSAGILHLNSKYVYDGANIELAAFFNFSDLTEPILALQPELPFKLAEFKEMLAAQNAPQITPSRHCLNPYPCEFWDHCTAEMPGFWVMGLTGIKEEKLNELTAMGVEDIRHIPEGFPLTELQRRIKTCIVNREDYLAAELEEELTDLEYPVHFLDFETVSPAIPIYPHTRPYQAIPFQWSDHILSKGGELHHSSFLFREDGDPQLSFVASLLEILGKGGTIITYSKYETRVLSELAGQFPEQSEQILTTFDRFKDLQALIKRYFYSMGFRGSFSLKSVLPVLVPDMSYENLVIREGTYASLEYLRMLKSETEPEEKRKIAQALMDYCSYDTLAMVKIREALLERF
jgi:hypothetical protein